MTLILDPIASLERQTLVFRSEERPEAEISPGLGRRLPTGGYIFVDRVRERLALIAGLTCQTLLPEGGEPPRIDVTTDRKINLRVQHQTPERAARNCAARLWRMGHACRVEERGLGQVLVRLERLPVCIRFTPNRSALLSYLNQRFEGRRLQLDALAEPCG
jgi:hypothetical protein